MHRVFDFDIPPIQGVKDRDLCIVYTNVVQHENRLRVVKIGHVPRGEPSCSFSLVNDTLGR